MSFGVNTQLMTIASALGSIGTGATFVGLAMSFNDTPYITVDSFNVGTLV